MNGYASGKVGFRNGHLNLSDAAAQAAAFVRAEGNDFLSGKVIALKKGEYRHRRKTPPTRIAKDYSVVLINVFHLCGELRTCLGVKFLLGLLDADHIVVGVFLHGVDLENIGLGKLRLNLVNDNLIVAFGKETDAAVHPVFSTTGVESDKCLCHNCDQLTDAKVGRFSRRLVINYSGIIIANSGNVVTSSYSTNTALTARICHIRCGQAKNEYI